MSLEIARLDYERRDAVQEACAGFSCAGPRHEDDPTVVFGDAFLNEGKWADLDEAGVTRTWGAWLGGLVVGYIALAADAVILTHGERKTTATATAGFSRFGCIQIAMLAVRGENHSCEHKIGTALVDHAQLIGREEIGPRIGARFLTADVNPPAQGFYERCGFSSLGSEREQREDGMLPMVLDLWPRA